MLILARREGEKISIAGGLITLTVMEIKGRRVRLGIDAPRDIDVNREEIINASVQDGRAVPKDPS